MGTPRIIRGRIELWTPHNGKELAFAYPLSGPNTYRNVGKQILENNQSVPTGDYTASLIHTSYCSELSGESEFQKIREIMKNKWLWVFNINTYTNKGIYSMKDLQAVGRNDKSSVEQLEEMLKGGKELSWGGIRFSKDRRVGFAPKGSYVLGEHTYESLAKDGLVIITYDIEGAEKLGEISGKFSNAPRTWGVEVEKGQVEKRVSALNSCYDRLSVDDLSFDSYIGGYASRVLK